MIKLDMKVYNTDETEADLVRKYNYEGSTLRRAQLRMLEMLVFLDRLCKENDIQYFIAYGTLLGAVRHGGFIPWDDDLDVFIDPKGLKKIRDIINSGGYDYVVQNHKNDKGFVRYYNVLRDLNSEYIKDEFQHNQRKYRGVQLDLFPYGSDVSDFAKRIIGKTVGLNEKIFLGKYPILSTIIFQVTNSYLIPFFKAIDRLKPKRTISMGYEGMEIEPHYAYDDIFPLKEIEFEGIKVMGPNKPENVLKCNYGIHYNDLPLESQRNHHKVLNIRFYK